MENNPENERLNGIRYVPTLDGWRAVAVSMVVVSHFANWPLFAHSPTLRIILSRGAFGVDIFFGLSGFLITSTLIQDFKRFGRVQVRDFYLRRLFRIIPPIVPFLIGLLFLSWSGLLKTPLSELRASLMFYRNFIEGGWNTGHFWSLAVEEHFYLIWPFLFPLLYSPSRTATPLLFTVILLATWRVLAIDLGFSGYYRTDVNLVGLAWGGTLAVLFQSNAFRNKLSRLFEGYRCIPLVLFLIASFWARFPLGKVTFVLGFPLLILSQISVQTPWSRVLESLPLRWLGKRSYSIYLWQQLATLNGFFLVAGHPMFEMFLRVVALLLVSTFSYSYIEMPFILLGRRLIAHLRRVPIAQERKRAA